MTGRVSFVGAGPGAADLITLRGARRIAEADIVVWAASLIDPQCIRDHAGPEAEVVDSSRITHEDVLEIYRRAARDGLKVARVHSGDPSLWGAVQEQYDAAKHFRKLHITWGWVPWEEPVGIVDRFLTPYPGPIVRTKPVEAAIPPGLEPPPAVATPKP